MRFYITLTFTLFLVGCQSNQSYRVISFTDDPTVHDPIMQTLGHKFILEHKGVRIVAHCWLSEHESIGTGCLELESHIGQTITLNYWKLGNKTMSDTLVYRPHGPDNEQGEEMLRIASASEDDKP